jgi:hypothetical protein
MITDQERAAALADLARLDSMASNDSNYLCSDFVDQHEATIRALLTEPQWRTIESAPRDGTRVIVAYPDFVTEAKYGDYRLEDETLNGWHFYDSEDPWYSVGFNDYPEPTHWMPLPKAPHGISGKEKP